MTYLIHAMSRELIDEFRAGERLKLARPIHTSPLAAILHLLLLDIFSALCSQFEL